MREEEQHHASPLFTTGIPFDSGRRVHSQHTFINIFLGLSDKRRLTRKEGKRVASGNEKMSRACRWKKNSRTWRRSASTAGLAARGAAVTGVAAIRENLLCARRVEWMYSSSAAGDRKRAFGALLICASGRRGAAPHKSKLVPHLYTTL